MTLLRLDPLDLLIPVDVLALLAFDLIRPDLTRPD